MRQQGAGLDTQRVDTVVVGGGQAGLATGYHLKRRGRQFVILDAGPRVGHAWRSRWDSLRLFTPASFDALPGLRFPAPNGHFPSKDEMADYLERYAAHFDLPVRLGVRVDALTGGPDGYVIEAAESRWATSRVVVATGPYSHPYVPPFAPLLDPATVQLHSASYRNPGQLREGNALVVGAGNSGAEIALELATSRETVLAGRDTGRVPIPLGSIGFRMLRHLRVDRWPGSVIARLLSRGGDPLVRVHPRDLRRAGLRRAGHVVGVTDGRPVLADGQSDGEVLAVANVVWCTGFVPDYRWIRLPVTNPDGRPRHDRGVVCEAPGLYFVGLRLQSTVASGLVGGVGVDAEHVVDVLCAGAPSTPPTRADSRTHDASSRPSRASRRSRPST